MIDLLVPYDQDVDHVIEIVREAFDAMRSEPNYAQLVTGLLEVLGVDDYATSGLIVKMYVETLPGRQWQVGRALRARIRRALNEAGVSIAIPSSPAGST